MSCTSHSPIAFSLRPRLRGEQRIAALSCCRFREPSHATNVLDGTNGVVEVGSNEAEHGVDMLELAQFNGKIVDYVGAEGVGFEACDGLRGEVPGVLGVVGVAIGDGLKTSILRDQRRDNMRESGERQEARLRLSVRQPTVDPTYFETHEKFQVKGWPVEADNCQSLSRA